MTANLIFVDSRVTNYQSIIGSLPADYTCIVIDSKQDGIAQMQTALAGYSNLSSIQIISHGSPGSLYLGTTVLNSSNLTQFSSQLSGIGSSLSASGDLLLYGCDVAQGAQGLQFIQHLSDITGADVAASTDLTGSATRQGNWTLEAQTGAIETQALSLNYDGTLAAGVTSSSSSFPRHSMGEIKNASAFAVIKSDGSVVTWGSSVNGGDSSVVANQLDGTIDVSQIFSSAGAFAALRTDGSVISWGYLWGNNFSAVAGQLDGSNDLLDVRQIFSNYRSFAALRADGSVITWGDSSYGGDSSAVANQINGKVDVKQVFSNEGAFAALRADGSVVTWGLSYEGGDSSAVASQLNGTIDVTEVFSNIEAFAALRTDGSVVTWGTQNAGGDSSAVANQLNGTVDAIQIFATAYAFAALRADGSVVTWGGQTVGGDSSMVASQLNGVIAVNQVFSNFYAFAALRNDGSVVTWGSLNGASGSNIDSTAVSAQLDGTIDVTQIAATDSAFAALRADGSVVTWGVSYQGGDSSAVASKINGSIAVVQLFSNLNAFAALRADGSVVTWGGNGYGGDSSAVASQLNGTIDVVQIFSTDGAFAALRADGSVVTWGAGGDSSAVANQLSSGVLAFSDVYSNINLSFSPPTAANATLTTTEDTSYIVKASDFGFADADSGDTLHSVTITGLPIAGNLSLNGVAVVQNQIISVTDINGGLLVFTPVANANGNNYADIGFRVSDGSLLSTSAYTLSIDVTPVNDRPTLTAFAAPITSGNEDSAIPVTFDSLKTQGDEADIDGTVTAFVIIAVNSGQLKIGTNLANATNWDSVSNNIVDANHIAYWTPAANANGTLNAFTVVAMDNGGLASLTPVQATINVTPVNDAPTLTSFASTVGTGYEDSAIPVTFDSLKTQGDEADIDGTVTAFVVKSVTSGRLTIGASAWDAVSNNIVDANHIANWTPAANASGTLNAFTVVAKDNGGLLSSTEVQTTVNVIPVRDDLVINGTKKADILNGDAIDVGSYDTLNGLSGNDTLNGLAGNDILNGGNGNDVLNGGDGNDALNGGSGIDTASYQGAIAGVVVSLGITVAQDTVGSNTDTLISIENLTGSDYNDTLTGNRGNNLLIGGAGDDMLFGGAGNDILVGGAGNDVLTGGDGRDVFLFNSAPDASSNLDVVVDFNVVKDTIKLSKSIFAELGRVNAAITKDAFYSGAGMTTAHDATDRIIYNTTDGALYYDSDGNGSAAAVQIATIENHALLTRADIWVVA